MAKRMTIHVRLLTAHTPKAADSDIGSCGILDLRQSALHEDPALKKRVVSGSMEASLLQIVTILISLDFRSITVGGHGWTDLGNAIMVHVQANANHPITYDTTVCGNTSLFSLE